MKHDIVLAKRVIVAAGVFEKGPRRTDFGPLGAAPRASCRLLLPAGSERVVVRPSGELGLIKTLCEVIVQVGILQEGGGDHVLAEQFSFG